MIQRAARSCKLAETIPTLNHDNAIPCPYVCLRWSGGVPPPCGVATSSAGACISAYGGGTLRRSGVTFAISTDGQAPALAGLLREGLEAVIPPDADMEAWVAEANRQRPLWRAARVPITERRPLLLRALNRLYEREPEGDK